MNIFQLLGLPADHRANDKKTTQLVKHFDEVPESRKKGKRYGVQLKKDGVCAITIIRDGMASIWSRTAKKFTNTSYLCHHISSMNLRDGVYFGEVTCDITNMKLEKVSLEVLSGIVNPNRVKNLDVNQDYIANNLTMNFFDMISIESFIKGSSQTSFEVRYKHLVERVYGAEVSFSREATKYVPDCVKVINLIPMEVGQLEGALSIAVENGEEGIVIIDLDADWVAGHKGWRKMKLVRGVDYDLLCIGYEEGTGKYLGKVANLIFKWKGGKTIKCMLGKGWTHSMAKDMFEVVISDYGKLTIPMERTVYKTLNPIGKVFQVYALEESSKGKLRLPKVGEQRHDKSEADI